MSTDDASVMVTTIPGGVGPAPGEHSGGASVDPEDWGICGFSRVSGAFGPFSFVRIGVNSAGAYTIEVGHDNVALAAGWLPPEVAIRCIRLSQFSYPEPDEYQDSSAFRVALRDGRDHGDWADLIPFALESPAQDADFDPLCVWGGVDGFLNFPNEYGIVMSMGGPGTPETRRVQTATDGCVTDSGIEPACTSPGGPEGFTGWENVTSLANFAANEITTHAWCFETPSLWVRHPTVYQTWKAGPPGAFPTTERHFTGATFDDNFCYIAGVMTRGQPVFVDNEDLYPDNRAFVEGQPGVLTPELAEAMLEDADGGETGFDILLTDDIPPPPYLPGDGAQHAVDVSEFGTFRAEALVQCIPFDQTNR